jgi:hypothetical protein
MQTMFIKMDDLTTVKQGAMKLPERNRIELAHQLLRDLVGNGKIVQTKQAMLALGYDMNNRSTITRHRKWPEPGGSKMSIDMADRVIDYFVDEGFKILIHVLVAIQKNKN